MIANSIRAILEKLNKYDKGLLEGAVGACVNRGHYEVTVTHILDQAFSEGSGDLLYILNHFKVDPTLFKSALQQELKELKIGNTGKPVFSPTLINILELAWSESSLNLGEAEIRTGGILLALRKNPGMCGVGLQDQLALISPEALSEGFHKIVGGSKESAGAATTKRAKDGEAKEGSHLDRFTVNFVEMAKNGKIDPIFGRDEEILQTIDILSRRRKNNPIMVGEAGVGKTAVIEGLALRIAEGKVPDVLKGVEIRSLDMGLLSAGAGVRGEFENRLKGVISEVKNSEVPIVLFIDEAHTMIGAGGEAGQNDAANLLKPEMARGELKILAATTFTEFRKYFEKDPAMARRFQMVNIKEPDPETAAIMLRGLRTRYESFHGVKISYAAIKAACELSDKFIAGRQLPDKAVDLLDTAAARVKMGLTTKPSMLLQWEQAVGNLEIELEALEKDYKSGILTDTDILEDTKEKLESAKARVSEIEGQWQKELEAVREIIALQEKLELEETSEDSKGSIRTEIDSKWKTLEELQEEIPLVHAHVSPEVVAQIISEWTGIPAGNMVRDEAETLLNLENIINKRVKGQSWGVRELANTLRSAKTGLGNPNAPMGVFLVTGPSGVGKTEVATTISDLLFGGEKAVVTINMSEYQDSMSVTQLKGASAGYVGYGDGGVLTEGVRKRPYTVVILDEVEKAHKDVLNMFYQVFDKGILRDGEGRDINFKNTVILMTSNLGLETITQMALEDKEYEYEAYREAIVPELTAHFAPALLARCKVVPFLPLGSDTLAEIVQLKLNKVGNRLMGRHNIAFAVSPEVIEGLVARCTQVQSGARNIDTIIDKELLPEISRQLLLALTEEKFPTHLYVGMTNEGAFDFYFTQGDFYNPESTPAEAAENVEEVTSEA